MRWGRIIARGGRRSRERMERHAEDNRPSTGELARDVKLRKVELSGFEQCRVAKQRFVVCFSKALGKEITSPPQRNTPHPGCAGSCSTRPYQHAQYAYFGCNKSFVGGCGSVFGEQLGGAWREPSPRGNLRAEGIAVAPRPL